jgi:transposase-like protein
MKTIFEFKTLTEFTDYFCDEAACVAHFTESRWRNGQYCPHCKHDKIYLCSNGKRYQCAACKQDFTIRTKTVFGESKLPLRKWYMAVYLLATSNKGISSVQLAKQVGVTQKTAWFVDHRLRSAMKQNKGQLFGTIEADETYIGGKVKNMHKNKRSAAIGTGGKGKAIVAGIRSRDGEVRATVINAVESSTLHPFIKANVQAGATLYTDEHRAYSNLGYAYVRDFIRHGLKEFSKGDCNTNGIESFWALFKRGYHGVYHQMSKKHLQRYVNEFTFRLNRKAQTMQSIFTDVVSGVTDNPQLPYKTLIQNPI